MYPDQFLDNRGHRGRGVDPAGAWNRDPGSVGLPTYVEPACDTEAPPTDPKAVVARTNMEKKPNRFAVPRLMFPLSTVSPPPSATRPDQLNNAIVVFGESGLGARDG